MLDLPDLREAIQKAVEHTVNREIDNGIEEIRNRIRSQTAMIAATVVEKMRFEAGHNELIIRVEFKK